MRRWVVLTLIFVGILVSYVDRGNLSLAVVPIMREFGYSAAVMGTLLSCFFWTYGIFQVPSGALVDRFGMRRIYAMAFLVWSLASAATGLSRGLAGFLTARLILGMAESVGPLASLSYIRRNFSAKEQALPTAIYLAGVTLGPAAGTLLGAHLLVSVGWRFLFVATGLGALVWLLPWLVFAPPDQTPREKLEPTAVSLVWPVAFGNPTLWVMTAFVFLLSYYWYFVLSWIPAYLTLVHQFNTLEMGHVLSMPLFAMAAVTIGAGAFTDHCVRLTGQAYRVRLWFMCAGMLGASTVLLLLVIPNRRWVLPVLLVSVCATGVASTNYWSLAQLLIPRAIIGRGIGYLNTVAQIAGAVAPLATGWLLGPSVRFNVALVVAGACPIVAALAAAALGTARLEVFRHTMDSRIGSLAEVPR